MQPFTVKLAVLFLLLNWPWCPRAWMKGGLGALPNWHWCP